MKYYLGGYHARITRGRIDKKHARKRVLNKKISKLEILDTKAIARPEPDSFCSSILGRKILGMRRNAKYLIFDFDDTSKMVVQPSHDRQLALHGWKLKDKY